MLNPAESISSRMTKNNKMEMNNLRINATREDELMQEGLLSLLEPC